MNCQKLRKLIKINFLFKCFCVLACTYQASKISQMYFSYKTTSNVKFVSGKFEKLLGITLCYSKLFQLKEEYVLETGLDKINSLSIDEQRVNFHEDIRLMLSCTIKYKVNCSQVTDIIGHFDQDLYCFTIFAQLNGEPDERYLVSEDSSVKLMISINLLKYQFLVALSFHDRTKPVLSRFVRGNFLLSPKGGLNLITYRKTVVKYLFNPSTDPCFEEKSYDDCQTECQINEFIESTGKHPPINLARSNSSLYFANMSEYRLFKWSDRCDRICGRFTDCYKEYYVVKNGETLTDTGVYQIMIDFPTHPTTIYEISLKMCFEEYLCLIASILSIWFGFSILAVTNKLLVIFQNFNQTNSSKNNLNFFNVTMNNSMPVFHKSTKTRIKRFQVLD